MQREADKYQNITSITKQNWTRSERRKKSWDDSFGVELKKLSIQVRTVIQIAPRGEKSKTKTKQPPHKKTQSNQK